jgi:hypothetical protein
MIGIAHVVLAAVLGSEPCVPVTAPPTWPSPQFGVATISGDKIEVRYTESVTVCEILRGRESLFWNNWTYPLFSLGLLSPIPSLDLTPRWPDLCMFATCFATVRA